MAADHGSAILIGAPAGFQGDAEHLQIKTGERTRPTSPVCVRMYPKLSAEA
jgi:hypothetical protein